MKYALLTIIFLLICKTCLASATSIGQGACTQYPAPNVLMSGCVGYWTFNEGVGSSTADSSGMGNNGTITGATWVDGIRGKCLSFDGDDSVNIGDPANGSLDFGTGSFSLLCKTKTTGTVSTFHIMYNKTNGGATTPGYTMSINNSGGSLRFVLKDGIHTAQQASKGSNYNDGNWYSLGVVFNKSSNMAICYADGVSIGSVSISAISSSTSSSVNFTIGADSPYFLKGYIDECRIYKRALSEAEIQTLFYLKQ